MREKTAWLMVRNVLYIKKTYEKIRRRLRRFSEGSVGREVLLLTPSGT